MNKLAILLLVCCEFRWRLLSEEGVLLRPPSSSSRAPSLGPSAAALARARAAMCARGPIRAPCVGALAPKGAVPRRSAVTVKTDEFGGSSSSLAPLEGSPSLLSATSFRRALPLRRPRVSGVERPHAHSMRGRQGRLTAQERKRGRRRGGDSLSPLSPLDQRKPIQNFTRPRPPTHPPLPPSANPTPYSTHPTVKNPPKKPNKKP